MSHHRRPEASILWLAFVLAAAAPLYYAAYQIRKDRRFQIGSMDRDFLSQVDQFSSPTMMNGPIRHEDGSVEVIDFYGRVTTRRVEILLPYFALDSPLRLFLRAHRFGLQGKVLVSVNGELLGEFTFVKSSYPWAGIRTIVPQSVAERGPLRIELVTEGGDPPPSHLSEAGVGLDWIDVGPMSEGAVLRPSGKSYAALYAFVLSGFAFSFLSGLSLSRAALVLAALVASCCVSIAFFPVETPVALARLWIVFPLALALYLLLARVRVVSRNDASFVSRLVAVSALAHSLPIFFPNHLPPDVPLHAIQVSWLASADFSYSGLMDYSKTLSRSITSEAVLMKTGRDGSKGQESAAGSFGAPYPPFFYILAFFVSRLHGDLRFVLEILAVLMASLMLPLVFLAAKTIWSDGVTARIAALLFAMEISVWHHANRGHAPGIFGALFVLLFLWYLAAHGDSLRRLKGVAGFALLTSAVALCYTVALIQISIFVAFFALFLLLFLEGLEGRRLAFVSRALAGFVAGVVAALALFYAPYVAATLTPSEGSGVLFARASHYDPPATFYVLRNQLRDTVRILENGQVLYVALSIVGLGLLRRIQTSDYHRCWVLAGVSTYALMLVLKDPAFLPRIFLHAKEDLFYAPFACLLGALPLAWLWTRPRLRPLTVAFFIAFFYLSIRDKVWNVDTLHPQPIAGVIELSPTPEIHGA